MPYLSDWEAFVHLAYIDESGTDGHSPIVMCGALIVPTGTFGRLEIMHSNAIGQILPNDRFDEFTEFHASELYHGKGVFEDVGEDKRYTAIQVLLSAVRLDRLPFIYAAVDRQKFMASPFGSGRPLLAAFHMCLLGVEDWATANHPSRPGAKQLDWKDTCLYIMDDCDEKPLKEQFRKTYRTLRLKHPFASSQGNRLWHAHDDMFFGDSKDCLGIQTVDLCNYFVRLHLTGEPESQNFYQIFSEQVICAKPDPEWPLYGDLFREHMVESRHDANAKSQTA